MNPLRRSRGLLLLVTWNLAIGAFGPRLEAQCAWPEDLKITSSDGEAYDQFGSSVALDHDLAVIGAPKDDDLGWDSGAAYVVELPGGNERHKLVASNGALSDLFGGAVDIAGNQIVVGACFGDGLQADTGTAYLFDAGTGLERFVLSALDGQPGDCFGVSVAIDRNRVLIGARYGDGLVADSGAVYVFEVSSGQFLFKLTANDGAANDLFGESVAISGDRALVGAPRDDDLGVDSGSAYVFDLTTGQQARKITASDGAQGDRFGQGVGIDGAAAAVGAPQDDDRGNASGSAYLLDVGSWLETRKLQAFESAWEMYFGESVEIRDDLLIVSAIGDDGRGSNSGAAYVYDVVTGALLTKVSHLDGDSFDLAGSAVSVFGQWALMGVPGRDDSSVDIGASYLFDVRQGPMLGKMVADDVSATRSLGQSLAYEGGVLAAGATHDHEAGYYAGAVYLFDVETGAVLRKLLPDSLTGGELFGRSLAMEGGQVLVGATGDSFHVQEAGAVYVFDRDTGQILHKIVAPDGQRGDRFGVAIAVTGDRIYVGADGVDGDHPGSGAVYEFERSSGLFKRKFVPDQARLYLGFGSALALDGGTLVVGASGSVFQVDLATGRQGREYVPVGLDFWSSFGSSLAVLGDRLVVGGPYASLAFVFDVNTGEQLLKLGPPVVGENQVFGQAIVLDESRIYIGAAQADGMASESGAVYVHDLVTGEFLHEVHAPDGARRQGTSADSFGTSLAVGDGQLFVGAPGDGAGPCNCSVHYGSVYRFSAFLANWSRYGIGYPGGLGVPDLRAGAMPRLGSTVPITVENSSGMNTLGLLLVGASSDLLPTAAGGTLLVSPQEVRAVSIPASGLTLSAPIPSDAALCGSAVFLQFLESDPAASHGISFSRGLRLNLGP